MSGNPHLSVWRIEGPMQTKRGVVDEVRYEQSLEEPLAPGCQVQRVPRLPVYGEEWDGTRFVLNEAMAMKHEEEARLNRLGRAACQREAVRQATRELNAVLISSGVISQEQLDVALAAQFDIEGSEEI